MFFTAFKQYFLDNMYIEPYTDVLFVYGLLNVSDDSWLNISPEQLDAILEKASGIKPAQSGVNNLNDVTKGMKSFINKVSRYEGAELPG